MGAYVEPLRWAAIIFPFLALALSLPFMVAQYHRYGSFVIWRAVVLYSFVFYLLAAYFMIILPLPSRTVVAHLTTPHYNLIPFETVHNFLATTVFNWRLPRTWLAAMTQPGFIQPVFNVVLTVPFGVYLRYYYKRPLWQVALFSFALSLFFELTQLSGLYGIYSRPYRLFDVDDLICNTTGGLIGGLLAPFIARAFPSREEMDAKSYAKGKRVSFTRRFVALMLDNAITVTVVTIVYDLVMQLVGLKQWTQVAALNQILPLFLVFVIFPLIGHGSTFGKWLVGIRVVKQDGTRVGFWRLFWREFLLYGVVLQSVRGLAWSFTEIYSKFHRSDLNFALLIIFGVICGFILVNFLWEFISRDQQYFWDVWAKTKQVSIVKPKKTEA